MNVLPSPQTQNIAIFPTSAIKRKNPRPPAAIPEKPVDHDYHQCLTISRTAKLLDVSPTTVRRMLESGRLQGVRNGRLVRVFQWSLDQYLIEHTTASEDTPASLKSTSKRTIKSTSHQVAMRELERLGL